MCEVCNPEDRTLILLDTDAVVDAVDRAARYADADPALSTVTAADVNEALAEIEPDAVFWAAYDALMHRIVTRAAEKARAHPSP